jgi:type II secretory pathway pseudopilin PulG
MLELLIAISITALAGLALSTVMTAVARSITSTTDERSALQRAHAASIRLRAFTEPGLCLLQDKPDEGFAIWLNDDKPGGTVNLREVRAFWHDATSGVMTVERVTFPDAWPPELQETFDLALSPGADFLGEIEAQRFLGYTSTEAVSDGVISRAVTHDAGPIQAASRFWLTLSMDRRAEDPTDVLMAFAFFTHREPE